VDLAWDDLLKCLKSGMTYLPNSLLLTLIPMTIGIIVGGIISIIRVFKIPVISRVLAVFVAVYNGIPLVVSLLVYHLIFILKFDDIAAALGLSARISNTSSIFVGYFALSLCLICWVSEYMLGAFLSIDKSQYEAAYTVGLSTPQALRRIIIPQVIPIAIPVLLNISIATLKNTSIVMTVGIMDVLNGALLPAHTSYKYLASYIAASIIYWTAAVAVEFLSKCLDKKLTKHLIRI
jgi:L-cystine transport system permease protein